jgi:hypothetical protein
MKKTEKWTSEPYEAPRSEVVELSHENHIMLGSFLDSVDGIDDITVDEWDWDIIM